MSLTYTSYTNQLANLMAQSQSDPNFTTFLPGCIDYAEQRLYRELNLLTTVVRSTIASATNTRSYSLPTYNGHYVTVTGFNVVNSGIRTPLIEVDRNMLDFLYPNNNSSASGSSPVMFSPLTDQAFEFGPTPGSTALTLEVVGTIRPTPLSSSNTTTWLSQYLPDLFIAASMVFATAYQRDFGAMTDNPPQANSWESQYQMLLKSADSEETRKRYGDSFIPGPRTQEK